MQKWTRKVTTCRAVWYDENFYIALNSQKFKNWFPVIKKLGFYVNSLDWIWLVEKDGIQKS